MCTITGNFSITLSKYRSQEAVPRVLMLGSFCGSEFGNARDAFKRLDAMLMKSSVGPLEPSFAFKLLSNVKTGRLRRFRTTTWNMIYEK
ncbi:uncharacterized protein EAF01_005291 [Botrytis porri]|uniref:uncharacterized protein n=1 Tax=Botrytis porri TaxID=87229 RepID=UPI001902B489|nr:uncharacterized protein EAF01_005291 [Botrytis porri]KAF7907705.1 hypothetical protein EAF01_005291 [Botrytis porri]